MSETAKSSTQVKRERWNANRCTWFGSILYPEEDPKHKRFISYLEQNKVIYPKFIYIDHYKDIYTQYDIDHWEEHHKDEPIPEVGQLKKRHLHFLFKRKNAVPASTVQNYFSCWLNHVEAIRDFEACVQYMLHNDPTSIDRGKPSYKADELQGDADMIQEAIIQNAKEVYFDNLLDIISSLEEGSLLELYEVLRRDSPEYFSIYKQVISNNSYIISRLCRDRRDRLYDDFQSRLAVSAFDAETREEIKKIFWRGKVYRYG